MKMPRVSKTELGSLLSRLREVGEVKNPNEAERRAAYLEKARQLRLERERQEGMSQPLSNPRSVVPFGVILASARFQILICEDPYHVHQSPIQEMAAVEYRGHYVAITRDGSSYSIRIDRNALTDKHNLTMNEAIAYVESKTWNGGE